VRPKRALYNLTHESRDSAGIAHRILGSRRIVPGFDEKGADSADRSGTLRESSALDIA
jgi:hypothetical protein